MKDSLGDRMKVYEQKGEGRQYVGKLLLENQEESYEDGN